MSTVHQRFLASAARWGDAEFQHTEALTAASYRIAPGSISWREAAAQVERLRAAYASAGYGPGHRVGLLLENRPGYLHHWFALNALGVSVVPINSETRAADLGYLVGHSEIALAVSLPDRAEAVREALRNAGVKAQVVTPDATDFPPPSSDATTSFADAETECALLYTSGTTGRPKGCRLSNAYFLHIGDWYAGLGGLCPVRPGQERIITPLPLNHVNAMAFSTMAVVTAGGCLIQLDRFHPRSWWQTVRDSGATIAHYLGVMPAMLLAAPPAAIDREHAVRWGFGAGVGRDDQARFEERFGFRLMEGWAMTETGAGGLIHINREPRRVGTHCIGRPAPSVEVRLVDDDGLDIVDEVPGELLVRASGADPRRHFFSGYLKDESATDEAWAGGWFHTGDMARRDSEGFLHFVDRKKNVIRRSGENISAVEVEAVLAQHPAVKNVAVAATPDSLRGDEVLACIVAREAIAADAQEAVARSIVQWALDQLAYYKAPGHVAFVDSLPLTLSQKVQRGELRVLAAGLPGQANCIDTRAMKTRQAPKG